MHSHPYFKCVDASKDIFGFTPQRKYEDRERTAAGQEVVGRGVKWTISTSPPFFSFFTFGPPYAQVDYAKALCVFPSKWGFDKNRNVVVRLSVDKKKKKKKSSDIYSS